MEDLFNLDGTNSLIIGGASGLGFEAAKILYSYGSNIIICGRDTTKLESSQNKIKKNTVNNKISYFQADITKKESIDNLFKYVDKNFRGKLNILINSAGINIRDKITEISFEDWNQVLNTNLTGVMFSTQKLIKLLKNAEYGRIINITSIFSKVSYPDRASYASSKGGLIQLTKTLALELSNYNITTNSISPGPMLTDINKKVLEDKINYEKFCQNIPLGRFGNPDEIATAIMFLASKYSSYVNGSDILIDGGWTSS